MPFLLLPSATCLALIVRIATVDRNVHIDDLVNLLGDPLEGDRLDKWFLRDSKPCGCLGSGADRGDGIEAPHALFEDLIIVEGETLLSMGVHHAGDPLFVPREALTSGGSGSSGAVEGVTELIHGSDLWTSRGSREKVRGGGSTERGAGRAHVVAVVVRIGLRLIPSPANFGRRCAAFGNDGYHFINGKEGPVEKSRDVPISVYVAGIT